ncbi:glycosyltransferase [Candidatus Omnitrophota bacterium]
MRILFISTVYPDTEESTRGTHIKKIASDLACQNISVDILTPKIYDTSLAREAKSFGNVHRFTFWSGNKPLYLYKKIPIFRMITYMWSGFWKCNALVCRNRYALIHAHWVIPTGLIGVIVAKLHGLPIVITAHGSDLLDWGKRPALKPLAKYVLRNASAITVNSSAMKSEAISLGADSEKIKLIYASGVDMKKFNPDISGKNIREQFNITEESTVILCVGRLMERKRVCDIVSAVGMLASDFPDMRLLVVGEGEEMENLLKLRAKLSLGDKVIMANAVANELLPEYYAASDMFVLASREEAMGVVLLEAMASAKPVIGSDVDGIRDVVSCGENGLLFKALDVSDLANKIKDLVTDPAKMKNLGLRGRAIAQEDYSDIEQVQRTIGVYNQGTRK